MIKNTTIFYKLNHVQCFGPLSAIADAFLRDPTQKQNNLILLKQMKIN